MIVTASLWAAGALILSAAIVFIGLRVVKSFGDYAASNREVAAATREHTVQQGRVTTLLLAVHESNQLLAGQNARMLEALKRAKSNGHQQGAA